MAIVSINPTTGETLRTFSPHTPEQVEHRLALGDACFRVYRHTQNQERRQWMYRVADILEAKADQWARLMTLEMGKPITAALGEVKKCAWVCRYYGDQAAQFLAPEAIATDAAESYVCYQPLGMILAVMPWNFPFWQVFRFAAPALMAGNVVLLKHASNVPQCALAIEQIFQEAGFPAGAFQTLLIGGDRVATVIADRRVVAATLTGSETAGSALAMAAGQHLKKTLLELGGSDPLIVLPSGDLEAAVQTALTSRMLNNGQSCIAAKRLILHEAIAPAFLERFQQACVGMKVGDPLDPETELGPLATAQILQELHNQVTATVAAGAKVLCGGQPLNRSGNFYPPTILTQIPVHSPGYRQEFFGPVALVFTVENLEKAIHLANDTPFGLGASAWTHKPEEQHLLIHNLEAGSVFINGLVKSDPRLPFGGIKTSGYGRELGRWGMLEFMNVKTVWRA